MAGTNARMQRQRRNEETMIKSMTGFGRCEYTDGIHKFTVEVKAVNHRYLDIGIRMPKKLHCFEGAIRSLLKEYADRGKVDVFISYEGLSEADLGLKYNEDAAAWYLAHLNRMAETFGLENDVRVSALSRYPEVFTLEEQGIDEEAIWPGLEKTFREAAEQFVESRGKEGEQLKRDLQDKLTGMLAYVDEIEERYPAVLEAYRQRLEAKVSELLSDRQIDEGRIAAEVMIFADKCCVDEETVRLRSHIKSALEALETGDSVGRKLDFIAQEMNREANTILSKSNDLSISDIGIHLKTDIEKVREQIQNIE